MAGRFMAIVLVTMLIAVTACSAKPATAPGGTVKEITVGYAVALSGPGSDWGINTVNAGELLFDRYNQAGGVKAGNTTYKFKIKAYDTKYNPAEGMAAVKRLVELDGAKYISVTGGALVKASRDYMRDHGVLGLNLMGVASGFMGPGYPLDFNFLPPPDAAFRGQINWLLKQNPSYKKAALMYSDDLANVSTANMEEAVLKELGIQIVGKETYARGMTDFSGMLSRLLPQKPDLIATASNNQDVALFLKQAWQMGFRGYTLMPGPGEPELTVGTAGEGAERFLNASVGEPFPEKLVAFEQKYAARYGKYAPVASDWGFLADVLPEAMKLAGSDDPKAIAEALRTKTINSSIWGPLTYYSKAEGDNWLIYKMPVSVIKNGKNVTVDWMVPK